MFSVCKYDRILLHMFNVKSNSSENVSKQPQKRMKYSDINRREEGMKAELKVMKLLPQKRCTDRTTFIMLVKAILLH